MLPVSPRTLTGVGDDPDNRIHEFVVVLVRFESHVCHVPFMVAEHTAKLTILGTPFAFMSGLVVDFARYRLRVHNPWISYDMDQRGRPVVKYVLYGSTDEIPPPLTMRFASEASKAVRLGKSLGLHHAHGSTAMTPPHDMVRQALRAQGPRQPRRAFIAASSLDTPFDLGDPVLDDWAIDEPRGGYHAFVIRSTPDEEDVDGQSQMDDTSPCWDTFAFADDSVSLEPNTWTVCTCRLGRPLQPGQAFTVASVGSSDLQVPEGAYSYDPDNPRIVRIPIRNTQCYETYVPRYQAVFLGYSTYAEPLIGHLWPRDQPTVTNDASQLAEEKNSLVHVVTVERQEDEPTSGATATTPRPDPEPLPEDSGSTTRTERDSQRDPELAFASLVHVRLTVTPVVLLYCGIGGFTRGLMACNARYGTAFRVVVAIDNDPEAILVHRLNFPTIPVVKFEFGKKRKAAYRLIEQYLPRTLWPESYWHASPSCKLSSHANMMFRNVSDGIKHTRWAIRFMSSAKPPVGAYTLEQEPSVAPDLQHVLPNSRVLDMYDVTDDLMCHRVRLIGSSLKLDLPVVPYDPPSLQKRYRRAYGYPGRELIVRSSFGHTRSADLPTFTITTSLLQLGPHCSSMQTLTVQHTAEVFGRDDIQWPSTWSDTRCHRHLAQVVPPGFACRLARSVYNSMAVVTPSATEWRDDVVHTIEAPDKLFLQLPSSDSSSVPVFDPVGRTVVRMSSTALLHPTRPPPEVPVASGSTPVSVGGRP
ncbi:MAG: hypothetical protein AAGD07_24475 [Planctomycetota bacterium]